MVGSDPAPRPLPSAPAVPQQAHSLALSSGAVFAASLLVQLLGVIGTIFLYKHIGITPTGQAFIGTAQLFLLIGSSINGIGDLRLGTSYTYFLARGKAPQDNTATYLAVRTAMVAAAGAILFAIAPLELYHHTIASSPADLESLGIFLTLPILWSFSTVYNQMFIGLGNSLKAQYPGLVEALVRLPVLIYVAYSVRTIEGMTIAYAVGASASAIYSIPALLPKLRAFSWREALQMFRFAWPLMGSLMLNYLVTNMVPLIVNAFLGPTELSVFLAANGWRVLVLSLPAAVTTPLFPYLAGLHRQERYEPLRSGTWQALRYSAMLLVPGVVALVTYRYTFLNVFANHLYAKPGALPLAILVVSAIPLALSQIIQSSINAIGRRRLELYITTTQVAVLLGAVVVLMAPWKILYWTFELGIVGGAIAVLLSSIAALALNTYFMETLIRVHIRPAPILRITVSAAVSFESLSLLNRTHLFPVVDGIELLAAVFLGFAVYFVVLGMIGELTQEDVRRIGGSLGVPSRVYEPLARLCWAKFTPALAPIDLTRAPGFRSTELPEPFSGTTELPGLDSGDTEASTDSDASRDRDE
ncbi:MAG: oligosaccharide flippase family protein [Thermoplasmata archaeon]